jgi:hypothetical protein
MLQSASLSLTWPWSLFAPQPVVRNQILLLDTHLVMRTGKTIRYDACKPVKLHYDFDRELQLANVCVYQGLQCLGYVPLPEAQQLFAWKKAGESFSIRLLAMDDEMGRCSLRLRVTRP